MKCIFLLVGLLVAGLMPILFVSGASAALIDIVVIGTWENAHPNPVVNKFGFVVGDKFVMKATYDDATFFSGPEGVTASIDPGINPGTSFEVIIPHAAGAPNPLWFDHKDHIDIGFASTAEIEFDGPNPGNPGNFRNFEIHTEFNFDGDQMEFDEFMSSIEEQTWILNATQAFQRAAVSGGSSHLDIVTNDITASAPGPYVFSSALLSLNLNGSSGGGSGLPLDFDWTGPGGTLANSPGANISFGLAESGLVDTTDTNSLSLIVTESFTDFVSASDNAIVSYNNAAPSVTVASGVEEPDHSITFTATALDSDLLANALVPGFETLTTEFLFNGVVFLASEGNVDLATLLGIFGGPGTFEVVARATDLAGVSTSLAFNIDVFGAAVPSLSPFAIAVLWSLLGLAGWRKLRR